MIRLVKGVSPSQWIMLVAMLTITSLMVVASDAHARSLRKPYAPKGQVISHCGWVKASAYNYTRNFRNTRIIQRKLAGLGYDLGRAGVDGKFGPKTRAALASFQSDYGLASDGVAGGETVSHLAYVTHSTPNVRRCKRPYVG